MAAPYLAVGVFLFVFHSAWLAILGYHVQIVAWSRGRIGIPDRPKGSALTSFLLPCALVGPALWVMLAFSPSVHLAPWLATYHLTGWAVLAMVPYYAVVNPVLEEVHWTPLRERTAFAHVAFAGYHVMLLSTLLAWPWLVVAFAALTVASMVWKRSSREARSLVPAILSHGTADLGIIVIAAIVGLR
jgi:hypothetical protein